MKKRIATGIYTVAIALSFIVMLNLLCSSCTQTKKNPCLVWPPADTIGKVLSKIPNGELKHEHEFSCKGYSGVNKYMQLDNPYDKEDVIKAFEGKADSIKIAENIFRIKGHYYSKIGNLFLSVRFQNWTKIFDSTGKQDIGWGVIADSGQILVEKTKLLKVGSFKYENQFTISEMDSNYILITLQEGSGNKLLLVNRFDEKSNRYFEPVINSFGTLVTTSCCGFISKKDGWYSGNDKLPIAK